MRTTTGGGETKVTASRRGTHGLRVLAVIALVVTTIVVTNASTHQAVRLDTGKNITLASGGGPVDPYGPGELWSGENPVEHCNACDLDQLLADNKAQSLQPGQMVNPATGDLAVGNTVFSIPADGGFFGLELNYDAQRATSEAQDGSSGGLFGKGWQSNFDTSVYESGSTLTVTQDNGSQVFYSLVGTSGGDADCPVGDYDDSQKYTTPNSVDVFCAPDRVDAQLGFYSSTNTYLFEPHGGTDTQTFNYYGVKINEGNNVNPILLGFLYDVSPGSGLCPSGTSGTCDIETTDQNIPASRSVVLQLVGNQVADAVAPTGAGQQANWNFGYDPTTSQLSVVQNDQTGADQDYGYDTGFGHIYGYDMGSIADPNQVANGTKTQIDWTSVDGSVVGMVQGIEDPASGDYTTYGYQTTTCAEQNSSCYGQDASQIATITYPDGEIDTDYYDGNVLAQDSYGPYANDQTGDVDWAFNYVYGPQDGPNQEQVDFGSSQVATAETDTVGNVLEYTDPNGIATYNFYNDSGPNNLDELCWTVQNASGNGDTSCNSPPTSTGSNPVTSYTYDSYGHLLSETNPSEDTTRYGYYDVNAGFGAGQRCWEAAPLVSGSGSTCTDGSTPAPTGSTVDIYDQRGNLGLTETDYNSSSTNYTYYDYDISGQMTYEVPPDGVGQGGYGSNPFETQYSYGDFPLGQLQQTIAPAYASTGSATTTTSYTYDLDGNVTSTTGAANVTTTAYDADDRKCWVDVSTAASSNSCSTPPSSSSSSAVTQYLGYVPETDAPTEVVSPPSGNEAKGNITQYTYGDARFPTSVTETTYPTVSGNNPTVQHNYSVYDQYGDVCLSGPVSETSCTWNANDRAFTYNLEGQLESTTDPKDTADQNGVVTNYTYGDNAYPTQPTQVVLGYGTANAKTTTTGYDAAGNEIYAEDNEGNYVSKTYDADGRLCWVAPQDVWTAQGTCPGSSGTPTGAGVTTYAYDGNSNMTTMVDNNGASTQATTSLTYDGNSNLLSETDDNGNTVSYQYDDAGNETCIAYSVVANSSCNSAPSSTNTVVDRAYDSSGRLTSTTDWLGNTIGYSNYNPLNELGTTSYPSVTSEAQNLSYDDAGNLTGASYSGPLAVAGSTNSLSWTPNAEDQVGASAGLDGYSSSSDVYNQYDRVAQAVSPKALGGSQSAADTYTYSPNGQIQKDQGPSVTTTYSYQAGSEALSQTVAGSTTTSFTYTGDGERQSQQVGSSTPTQYGWNNFGQLCYSATSTTTGAPCTSPPSGATTYAYNGMGLRMTQQTTTATTKFTWDMVSGAGTPLMIDNGGHAYIYGPLLFGGTAPVEEINLINDKVTYLASTPEGVQVGFDHAGSSDHLDEQAAYTPFGTQVLQSGTNVSAFGFQGSYTDSSGLIYLINRYYDPGTDQFVSIDPAVEQTGQPYAFTGNNPLNASDPLGLFCIGCQIAAQSAVYESSPPATQAVINVTPNGIDGWIADGAPGWEPSGTEGGGSDSYGRTISAQQALYDEQVGDAWRAGAQIEGNDWKAGAAFGAAREEWLSQASAARGTGPVARTCVALAVYCGAIGAPNDRQSPHPTPPGITAPRDYDGGGLVDLGPFDLPEFRGLKPSPTAVVAGGTSVAAVVVVVIVAALVF